MMKQSHLGGIETIRMIAAFLVIAHHTHALAHLATPSGIAAIIPYFGQAVPLLFAISGFILSYIYFDQLKTRDNCFNFYIKRLCRITPLFYFMLMVWLVMMYFNWGVKYSPNQILLNISLLFNLVPGQQESIVWAGWSIGIEVVFYLLFPIFINGLQTLCSTLILLGISLFVSKMTYDAYYALGASAYAYMNFVHHLPFFTAGIMAFQVWNFKNLRISQQSSSINFMYFITTLYVGYQFTHSILGTNTIFWGIEFILLIVASCYWKNIVINNGIFTYIGSISYSLYLMHPFIIELLLKFNFYQRVEHAFHNTTLSFFISEIATILIVVLVSSHTHKYIEVPGIKLGEYLIQRSKQIPNKNIDLSRFYQFLKRGFKPAVFSKK